LKEIIINATNIGQRLDGIGVYSLNLLKALPRMGRDKRFVVLLNKKGYEHIKGLEFPENLTLRFTYSFLSPDLHLKGHLLRLLYSNLLSLGYKECLIFTTGQLEALFLRRSKQVITVHDVIPLLFKEYHRRQYYYFKYLLGYALRSAKGIIVPSRHVKDTIVSTYRVLKERIYVIHHGISLLYGEGHTACRKVIERPFILYIGRLAPMKNIPNLLKAFHIIKDRIEHDLILAGEIQELTIPDDKRIIYKGWVSEAEKTDLYRNASLLVFPTLYEGFGLPPLEAMACGCPVVVSNVASLPEVCGDAAYYVNPHSPEDIARGIVKVLIDTRLRQSLIRKGLERSRLFSWERSAKEHLKVFDDVLDEDG